MIFPGLGVIVLHDLNCPVHGIRTGCATLQSFKLRASTNTLVSQICRHRKTRCGAYLTSQDVERGTWEPRTVDVAQDVCAAQGYRDDDILRARASVGRVCESKWTCWHCSGLTRLAFKRSNIKQTSKFAQEVKKNIRRARVSRVIRRTRMYNINIYACFSLSLCTSAGSALCGTSHGALASGERRKRRLEPALCILHKVPLP
ncbi:hypothetical protein C8Q74DRAFT_148744 [Fomes fomentarius]|nr:hypothetical protein C8Q74DRAFT_148744 [Fomes fomentarius]